MRDTKAKKRRCKTVVKVEKLKEVVLCKISIKESNSCAEVMTRTNVLSLIINYENQRDEYVEAKISIKAKEYTNKCQRRCTVLSLQVHLPAKKKKQLREGFLLDELSFR